MRRAYAPRRLSRSQVHDIDELSRRLSRKPTRDKNSQNLDAGDPIVTLHLQTPTANILTGFGEGWIRVGATEYRENLVLTPETVHPGWAPGGLQALAEDDFRALLEYRPEIVLIGTGKRQRFPHARFLRPLVEAQVGVEIMDTHAACRTFNILIAEERRVVAALVLD